MLSKLWLIIAATLLVTMQYEIWFAEDGLQSVWRTQRALNQQLAKNDTLRAENKRLAAEIQQLKKGNAALEERAREELGMIKPGETFYQLLPKDSS